MVLNVYFMSLSYCITNKSFCKYFVVKSFLILSYMDFACYIVTNMR